MVTVKGADFRTGRKDLEDYMRLSGVREEKKLSHYPFLVVNGDSFEVCKNLKKLLDTYPDHILVVTQWQGQWNSDYFAFTVGDIRRYVTANPPDEYMVA